MRTTPNRRRWALSTLLLATSMALAVSCTLLGSRDLVQCAQNADCKNGPQQCVDGLCAIHSGQGATDANASDGGAACQLTKDCDQSKAASVCANNRCIDLFSEVCPATYPVDPRAALQREDTVVVASYTTMGTTPGAEPGTNAVRYAFQDFAENFSGSKLVVLHCAKDNKAATPLAAATAHLVSRGIPVLFGQFESVELLGVTPETKNALALWSTLGNRMGLRPSSAGGATQHEWFFLDELSSLEPGFQVAFDLAPTLSGASPGGIKVAMITDGTSDAKDLGDAIEKSLVVEKNSPPVASKFLRNLGDNYQRRAATDLQSIFNLKPHVIIGIGGDEIAQKVLQSVEGNISSSGSAGPTWLLTSRLRFNQGDLINILTKDTTKPKLASRIIGVDYGGDHGLLSTLSADTNSRGLKFVGSFDVLYDASYAVAFAALRARQQVGTRQLSADDMVAGLRILTPGDNAGALALDAAGTRRTDFTQALGNIKSNIAFYLKATSGTWKFDSDHNRRNDRTSYFCIGTDRAIQTYFDAPLPPSCTKFE